MSDNAWDKIMAYTVVEGAKEIAELEAQVADLTRRLEIARIALSGTRDKTLLWLKDEYNMSTKLKEIHEISMQALEKIK